MPHRDKAKRAEYQRKWKEKNREHLAAYDRKYQAEHREQLAAYRRNYRQVNREEIAENAQRRMRVWVGHRDFIYLGTAGMTRKQRQKFQEELMNGTTDGSRST